MWRPLLILTLLLLLRPLPAVGIPRGSICASLEIYSVEDMHLLRNCSIVVGHVHIAEIEFDSSWTDSALVAAYRSEIQEITDYLLIYRVYGLRSLELIFPRLTIIRGQALLFDEYSLVIYENRDLENLGLVELLRIQAGQLRIESNPMLCFAETINWLAILGNITEQRFALKRNKPSNHCRMCEGISADYSKRDLAPKYCWNVRTKQLLYTPPRLKDCPKACGTEGCDKQGNCCERSCVTGCSASSCDLCGNYQENAKCVDECVDGYRLNKRECVSMSYCRKLGHAVVGNDCLATCPDNHRTLYDSTGGMYCNINCTGDYVIKRTADLAALTDCVILRGTLTIELIDVTEQIITALETALGAIKEITGYLKVVRSAPLMSLGFLGKLETIRGDVLSEQKYALYVVGNDHLEHIWNSQQRVALLEGTIFFHLNPRLCHHKILELEPYLKAPHPISIADISPNSNGERVICGDDVRNLNVSVEAFNATAVRMIVELMRADDIDVLLGYSYHYKVAPEQNVTMYEGRHGCGHDDWLMDLSIGKNRRHVIYNLAPYTQYAYFVKTITRTDYHIQVDAYSKIQYFRTLPTKPSRVSKIYADSPAATEIMLHWWPPHKPNGDIDRYVVSYKAVNETISELELEPTWDYAVSKFYILALSAASAKLDDDSPCECKMPLPYYSGQMPDDEHYYSKDQITYEEALPNIIYVSRRDREKSKKDKFLKVKDYADLTTPPPTAAPPKPTPKVTTVDVASNETQRNRTEYELIAEQNYKLFREHFERKAILAQDTGIRRFEIVPPPAVCSLAVPNTATTNCAKLEHVEGISVPGNQHYLLLQQLLPEQTYSITVRACVKDVPNGCSNPTMVLSKTMSMPIEHLLEQLHRFD